MALRLYQYPKCSSCRKAIKFLNEWGVEYESIDISTSPPTEAELRRMLAAQGNALKKLFNTSGQVYRELNLSQTLPSMDQDEAFKLLAGHGKLVKRPFVLLASGGLVGFKPAEWESALREEGLLPPA